jgi:hypothetical protein
MEDGVTLITPTGYRPEAFSLCKEYVLRQTYTGPLQWIIVDDAHPPMDFFAGVFEGRRIETRKIHPLPNWFPGQNTLARNLLAAIPAIRYDKILFFEDDDWYGADYIDNQLANWRADATAVGETHAIYYNIEHQLCLELKNEVHASMCQTGIRDCLIPMLKRVCEVPTAIDIRLWAMVSPEQRALHPSRRCVGIKGLPGRPGLGMGHRPPANNPLAWGVGWGYDGEWRFLKALIGDDYLHYKAISTKDKEGEFEIFFWNGQKRYRCNQRWENGIPCAFDTFDYRALIEHVTQPHGYSGRRAPALPRKVISPIVGPQGEEIIREEK